MAEHKTDKLHLQELRENYKKSAKEVEKSRAKADELNIKMKTLQNHLHLLENEVSTYEQKQAPYHEYYSMDKRNKNRELFGKIDNLCENTFDQLVEKTETLEAEVIFEDKNTIITIDEDIIKTFGDLKILIAQLYYLNEKDFYLADVNGNIFLDFMSVRPELSSVYKHRIVGPPPKIRLILKEFKSYSDLLGTKKFATIETEEGLFPKLSAPPKHQEASTKLFLNTFKNTFQRYKGFVVMCLFITLIVLFIEYLRRTYRINESYFLKDSIENIGILSLFKQYEITEFAQFISQSQPGSSDLEGLATGFFYQHARLITTHYNTVACPNITSVDLLDLYSDKSLVCKDGQGDDRITPFVFTDGKNTQTVNYSSSPGGSKIMTDFGPYETVGYIYDFALDANTTLNNNTLLGLFNASTLRYGVLIANYAQPALDLVAQVNFYKAIYNYNVSVTSLTANVINIQKNSVSDQAIVTMVSVLTSFLLLIAVCELARIVRIKNEGLDRELILYKEKRAKERRGEPSAIDLRNFWVFKFPLIIVIIYSPTPSQFTSFVALCLIITGISVRTYVVNHLGTFDFESDDKYFNFSPLYHKISITKAIIDSMILVLIMFGLINQVVDFLQGELVYFQKVISKVSQEYKWFTPLLVWLLFVSTLSSMVAFGENSKTDINFGRTFFEQMRATLRCYYLWEDFYGSSNRVVDENVHRQIGMANAAIPNILLVVIMKYIMMSIFIALVVRLFPEVKERVRETKKTLNSLSFQSIKLLRFKKKKEENKTH